MPRQSRFVLPNCPHHIIQRGHNRQVVFTRDDDYLYYLDNLREWKTALDCKVYAYCLMTNHVHLVVDPGSDPEKLGLLMKRLAGRQARYINTKDNRSGSLWEGRYKSSPIEANQYLLACCRYVELNPVRAGMVDDPAQYHWSSCSTKVHCTPGAWLDLDPFYLSLGNSAGKRAKKYALWLQEPIPESELELIRDATQQGRLTANDNFIRQMADTVGRCLEVRKPGRPRKDEK